MGCLDCNQIRNSSPLNYAVNQLKTVRDASTSRLLLFQAPIWKIIGKARREKSLAHCLFPCSQPFLHMIWTDRKPGAGYTSTSTIDSLEGRFALLKQESSNPFITVHWMRVTCLWNLASERSVCKMFAFPIVSRGRSRIYLRRGAPD